MNYREIIEKLPKSELQSIISSFGSEEMIRMIEAEYNHFFLVHHKVVDPDSQVSQQRIRRRVFCTASRAEAEEYVRKKNKYSGGEVYYGRPKDPQKGRYYIEEVGGDD